MDLKKHSTSIAQAKSYLRLHAKLQEMGVDGEEADRWLDVSRDIASATVSSSQFIKAALELARLTSENGPSYESLIEGYKTKVEESKTLDAKITQKQEEISSLSASYKEDRQQATTELDSISRATATAQEVFATQKNELKADLDEHLIQNRLSWDKVNTAIAIFNTELDQQNLTKNDKQRISKDIREVGSLRTMCKRLENKEARLQAKVDGLAHARSELARVVRELQDQDSECQKRLRTKKGAEEKHDEGIRSKSKQLQGLDEQIFRNVHDIFVAYLILKFLVMPNQLNTYELDRLVDLMIAIRQTRAGIRPKRIVGFDGKTVCACEVPKMFTSFDENETRIEEARDRFAAFIRPIIEDRFVSSWAHQALKTECECLKASLSLIRGVKK